MLEAGAIAELVRVHAGDVVQTSRVEAAWEGGKLLPACWVNSNAKSPVVHAAKLLNHVITTLTENRLTYRKTLHAPELVEHLLQHKSDSLIELKKSLQEVISGQVR